MVKQSSYLVARSVVLSVLALLAVGLEAARAGTPSAKLSLDKALELALADNHTLQAKENELKSVRAGETTAGLIPNPQAGYTASNLGGRAGEFSRTDNLYTLQATIETAGKRERRVEFAKAGTRVTGSELEDVRRIVILQVKTAFIGVLAGKAKVDLASSNIKSLNEIEHLQKLRAEKGDISDLDLLRIEGQRLQFEADLADAQLAVKSAKIQLRQVISQERLSDNFDCIGELKYSASLDMKLDREGLRARAVDVRPDVAAARRVAEKAGADLQLAKAKAVPDIQPQVGLNDTHDNGKYFSIGGTVSLPIFDRNQGEIARATSDIERYSRLVDAAKAQVITDVDTAIAILMTAKEKYKRINGVYLPKAKTVRERVELSYRKGAANLLDYLESQRSYRETSKAGISALSDLVTAVTQLEAAVGESIN